jgi:hypothetical protein
MSGVIPTPTIWRTKLRSLKPGVDHQDQVDHNFDDGIVGIGWGIEGLPDGASLDDVLAAIDASLTGPRMRFTRFAVSVRTPGSGTTSGRGTSTAAFGSGASPAPTATRTPSSPSPRLGRSGNRSVGVKSWKSWVAQSGSQFYIHASKRFE